MALQIPQRGLSAPSYSLPLHSWIEHDVQITKCVKLCTQCSRILLWNDKMRIQITFIVFFSHKFSHRSGLVINMINTTCSSHWPALHIVNSMFKHAQLKFNSGKCIYADDIQCRELHIPEFRSWEIKTLAFWASIKYNRFINQFKNS